MSQKMPVNSWERQLKQLLLLMKALLRLLKIGLHKHCPFSATVQQEQVIGLQLFEYSCIFYVIFRMYIQNPWMDVPSWETFTLMTS